MSTEVYRLDQFIVPLAARAEFMARVSVTHAILRQQSGLVSDDLMEQPHGAGAVRIVTVARWRDEGALRAAREQVRAKQAEQGFNPEELMARLGVKADLGVYRPINQD